jgi:TPP-dependent pyruvate/acetoin dehydrogenase alpha subunit
VAGYRLKLLEDGAATEEEMLTMEKEAAAQVEAGVAFARSSPDPKAEESTRYVYTDD